MIFKTELAQGSTLSGFLVYSQPCGLDNNQKNHFYDSFKSVAN